MYTRHRDELPNGLRVVTLEVPHLHTALLAAYVRCGSRHETPENNGVSHFLEHMLFRGSEAFPDTTRMNGLVEDVGGSLNGVTMRDQGLYYTPLHPAHLKVGFTVLGDLLRRPLLRSAEIEREIILEEMMDEIDPDGRDIDPGNLSKRLVFGEHALALKIAGTTDSVRALTLEQMRAHHRRFYCARNMVLTVAGPVRRDQALELAAEAFGALPPGELAREEPAPLERKGPAVHFVEHDESQTELLMSFPCVPESHPDHFPLTVCRAILDDGLTSWLPLHIVEQRGLVYSVHANVDVFHDVALFELDAACTPAKVVPVVEEMARLLGRLASEPLPEEELARVKTRYRIGLDFTLDDLNGLAGWYGGTELFREPELLEERCRRVEAVTAEQVQEVARRTFTRDNLHLCAVGPAKGKAEAKLRKAVEKLLP